jgi:hypothetical protein
MCCRYNTPNDLVDTIFGAVQQESIFIVCHILYNLNMMWQLHVRWVHYHGMSSGCGWRNGLQLWRIAVNILNKQINRAPDLGGFFG